MDYFFFYVNNRNVLEIILKCVYLFLTGNAGGDEMILCWVKGAHVRKKAKRTQLMANA